MIEYILGGGFGDFSSPEGACRCGCGCGDGSPSYSAGLYAGTRDGTSENCEE